MSGLIGYLSDTARPSPSPLPDLRRVYEAVRGTMGEAETIDSGFAGVVASPARDGSAATLRSDSTWAAFVGRPYGLETWGGRLEHLDGQFALVAVDEAERSAKLATDPFGMQPLFIADRGDTLFFSTSALALARYLKATPSPIGVKVFLRAGYLYGSLTLWEGITRLEPGSAIDCFDGQRTAPTSYYRPELDRRLAKLKIDDVVDRCIDVLVAACRTNLGTQQQVWSDLTGGFDSRLLTLALAAAGVPFCTTTTGSPEDPDVRLARAVAAAANWPWTPISVPDDWGDAHPSWLTEAVAWSDGALPVLQVGQVLVVKAELSRRGPRRLMQGGAFEHASGYAWQQEFHRAGRSSTVNLDNLIYMKFLNPIDMRVFTNDFTPEVRDDFKERMAAFTAPYRDELNTVQLDLMYAYKNTGHFGAWAAAAHGYLETEIPAYYKAVFETFFSIAPGQRNFHRLHRHLLERLNPTIAALPTTRGGPGLPMRLGNALSFEPYYRILARKAVVKLRQRAGLIWATPPVTTRAAATNPKTNPKRNAALRAIADLKLDSSAGHQQLRLGGLVSAEGLNRLLADTAGGSNSALNCLDRILTVESALRVGAP